MIWLDMETRSTLDVTEVGAHAMSQDPTLQILSIHYAFDDGPVQNWRGIFSKGDRADSQDPVPAELMERIGTGETVMIFNEAFDRLVWNAVAGRSRGIPRIELEQTVDVAALCRAHNIPGKLETAAAVWLPREMQKLGNQSFKPLWSHKFPIGPSDLGLYEQMLTYGDHDVVAMREVAKILLPPDSRMLAEYQAAERINMRGVGVYLGWCRKAVEFRDTILDEVGERLSMLTNGAITSVSQYKRHRVWAEEQLTLAGITLVEDTLKVSKKKLRSDGAGYTTKVTQGFDKNVRAKLKQVLEDEAPKGVSCQPVLDLIDLLDEASGSAAVKYAAAVDRASEDGILRGMYIWSGASQTGRFSAGGLQPHNLIRKSVDSPSEAIERLMEATPAEAKAYAAELGMPLNALLGRLLRPTLVPRAEENCVVWADWSAIEARVCPWLSDDPEAEPLLDLFREDKDVYLVQAEAIVGHPVAKADPERQLGKVAVLSLGFGGSVGAYAAMAKNYGIAPMSRDKVQDIVDGWREANPWARRWWDSLWEAAMAAIRNPCEEFVAGRVTLAFLPALLDGALVMWLPCGRPLIYPSARIQNVYKNDDRPETGITFLHASFGRMPLWYGQLAENATQATAASLLREVLVDLELGEAWSGEVVAHTHDEVVAECRHRRVAEVADTLRQSMTYIPDWAKGLPLAVEVKAGWAYYEEDPALLG